MFARATSRTHDARPEAGMERMGSLGRTGTTRSGCWLLTMLAAAAGAGAPLVAVPHVAVAQQPPLTADDQAAQLLNAARRAFNDGKLDQSAAQFREFLQKYANHADAAAASYGLGLSLIEGPQKDYT